jgi:hypothetical protein
MDTRLERLREMENNPVMSEEIRKTLPHIDKGDLINGLSQYLIEVVKAQAQVERGRVDVALAKNGGEVVGVKTTTHRIVNFPNRDNREALVLISDYLENLGEEETEITFKVATSRGRVNKVIISREEKKVLKN